MRKYARLRAVKDNLLGIPGVPDDPFELDRNRMAEFVDVLSLIEMSVNSFDGSLSRIGAIQDELILAVTKLTETDGGVNLGAIIDSLSTVRIAYSASVPKLAIVRMRIGSIQSRYAEIDGKLKVRDRLYWDRAHYEAKIANLTDKERLDSELVDRNVKKRSKAITEFAETEKGTLREAKAFVRTLDESLDGLLILYSRFISEYFGGILANTDDG